MINWFLKNKILGSAIAVGSILLVALVAQTWRVSSLKSDIAIYQRDLEAYEQTLKEVRENAVRREDAILQDFAREKVDYERMLQAIENTYRYENKPLPDGILDTIDELYEKPTDQNGQD